MRFQLHHNLSRKGHSDDPSLSSYEQIYSTSDVPLSVYQSTFDLTDPQCDFDAEV